MDDISDAYWCCCRKCRIKRQREQEIEATRTTTTDPIRSYNTTRHESEQRELQQRQLPIMASIRRRERQLHQLRLENNARWEKRKRKINQETQVRRALLLSKFKEAGLEKTLTIDDFVLNSAESDEIPQGDETTECTADDKANENNCEGGEEPSESSGNANGQDRCDQPKEEEQSYENPKAQTESLLRINWDQSGNGSLHQTHTSIGESSIATYPNECAICLQEYRPNDVIAVSDNPSCMHCYHRDCIVEYLIPLLDFEGKNDDSNENGANTAGTESTSPPSLSAAPSHGGKEVPCPCCRLPFLLDAPKIEESVSLPSLSV